jgi:hypothetical protein
MLQNSKQASFGFGVLEFLIFKIYFGPRFVWDFDIGFRIFDQASK